MAPALQYRFIVKYNDLDPLLARLDGEIDKSINRYAKSKLIPAAQRQQAPHIDTGALNASGEVIGQGFMAVLVKFTGGAPGWYDGLPRIYAEYHEYGTRFTGAYPFLLPAVDETWPGNMIEEIISIFQ